MGDLPGQKPVRQPGSKTRTSAQPRREIVMSTPGQSRRDFLLNSVSGLGAAWVATHYSAIIDAAEYAEQTARSGQAGKFAFFTPEQATEVEAMAAQIIPTDATPGAREAR